MGPRPVPPPEPHPRNRRRHPQGARTPRPPRQAHAGGRPVPLRARGDRGVDERRWRFTCWRCRTSSPPTTTSIPRCAPRSERDLADGVKFLVSLRLPGGRFARGLPLSPTAAAPGRRTLTPTARSSSRSPAPPRPTTPTPRSATLVLESAAVMYGEYVRAALRIDPDSENTKGFYQWGSMAFYELYTDRLARHPALRRPHDRDGPLDDRRARRHRARPQHGLRVRGPRRRVGTRPAHERHARTSSTSPPPSTGASPSSCPCRSARRLPAQRGPDDVPPHARRRAAPC